MKKKQTAVIGAGWFGQAHIRNFKNLSKLVAVCDSNITLLEKLKNQYEEVRFYSDIDEMLESESIDAASVVTPPKSIPEITKKLVKKDIDVLMEKPMALKLEDLTYFKQYDSLRIMPGFIEIFNPVFDKLKKNLNKIGNIISIASKRVGLYPKRNWQMGVILDLSIHDIYLQKNLIGKEIVEVRGIKQCLKDKTHADAAFINLDFGSAIGHIESNWLTPSKYRKMYVSGEEGTIKVDFISQQIKIRRGVDLQGEWPESKEVVFKPLRPDEPLKREILNFLYDKELKVNLNDGIEALKIALEIVNKGM